MSKAMLQGSLRQALKEKERTILVVNASQLFSVFQPFDFDWEELSDDNESWNRALH